LQLEAEVLTADIQPRRRIQYIRNDAPHSGIVHIARDEKTTVCGWRFSESAFASETTRDSRSVMCKQCKSVV
jgi:hypothetical protein